MSRCAYELTGPCRTFAYGPEALCPACRENGGPLPEPPCRCKQPRVEGKKLCAACLEQARAAQANAVSARRAPSRPGEKECTRCHTWRTLDAFHADGRKRDGRRAYCNDCDKKLGQLRKERAWARGVRRPAKVRPPITDGRRWCSCCDDWLTLESFTHNATAKDGYSSWCKACTADGMREARALRGAKKCPCGKAAEPEQDACSACLEMDGVTGPEGMVISALRVLGGEAQMAAIVEDIGGDINEDHRTGAGFRRAYRGIAALREQGRTETTYEGKEGATLATHRLRERR